MKPHPFPGSSILFRLSLFAVLFRFAACQGKPTQITDAVRKMADNNSTDLNSSGPVAWTRYFDRDNFQMTVNGRDVYPSYGAALKGIEVLKSEFKRTDLHWENQKIKELGSDYAEFTADYKEEMIRISDSVDRFQGTFAALAHKTAGGWKWKTIHWTTRDRR